MLIPAPKARTGLGRDFNPRETSLLLEREITPGDELLKPDSRLKLLELYNKDRITMALYLGREFVEFRLLRRVTE